MHESLKDYDLKYVLEKKVCAGFRWEMLATGYDMGDQYKQPTTTQIKMCTVIRQ